MKTNKLQYVGIDLFSGCGGLSVGMQRAGFDVKVALELNPDAAKAYKLNHPKSTVIEQDIRKVSISKIKKALGKNKVHLLAGCPPCQGFSSVRRLNKKKSVRDDRNNLILEYLRLVKALNPLTIMMENVPGLMDYYLFKEMVKELQSIGYNIDLDVVNVKDYGVPQNRKRLVMVGSRLGEIKVDRSKRKKTTVKDAIGKMPPITKTKDPLHKLVAKHSDRIMEMIELIPKDGGSRKDLPAKYTLECHKKEGVGFNDVYGRLKWNTWSTTITGGCLNPSKGRFLHPKENRVISAREASLLQTFPKNYKFPLDINKDAIALLIGNALPPKFSYVQSSNIYKHLNKHLVK